jgi:hypothetical protein
VNILNIRITHIKYLKVFKSNLRVLDICWNPVSISVLILDICHQHQTKIYILHSHHITEHLKKYKYVGFGVLTAVVMYVAIFWDTESCSIFLGWLHVTSKHFDCTAWFNYIKWYYSNTDNFFSHTSGMKVKVLKYDTDVTDTRQMRKMLQSTCQ